jgi:glycosyltransferase involved in cell wall biosynthesis
MNEQHTEYVLVTEYFHPDTASTGQLMTDLATGLESRGLDMTVYTGQPNYHSGDNKTQPRTSTYRGVQVNRISVPQLRQTSLSRRLFNWLSFTIWMFVVLLLSRPDSNRELVFVSNPPFLPIAMWLVAMLRGWEYTHIVYDVYPDMAIEPGHIERGGVIDRLWSWLDGYVFRNAANIVALGPAMKETIVEYAGPAFDEETVTIIHNWEDPDFITPVPKSENWFSREQDLVDTFTVLYSGNIGDNHDLETVVRAATAFRDDPVTFLIIGEGDGKAEIVQLAETLGLDDDTVRFLPYQPYDDLPYTLTCGDVTVVSVSDGMRGVCVSSKLYTSMAAKSPVLVVSHPEDDEARIVRSADAGKVVRQGDTTALVEAIEAWRANPELVDRQGRNARQTFEAQFTKQESVDRYYELLTGDVAPRRPESRPEDSPPAQ